MHFDPFYIFKAMAIDFLGPKAKRARISIRTFISLKQQLEKILLISLRQRNFIFLCTYRIDLNRTPPLRINAKSIFMRFLCDNMGSKINNEE